MTTSARARIVAACIALTLGAMAVGMVKVGTSNPVTGLLWRGAEVFASPGELLWWATLGGASAGYPSGASGYFLWVVGTALFWFGVALVFLAASTRIRALREGNR